MDALALSLPQSLTGRFNIALTTTASQTADNWAAHVLRYAAHAFKIARRRYGKTCFDNIDTQLT
ncbi:hypothetical protein AA106555_1352 [Neokomagataea thailandica NBRC 106555]|uniref:Transposase n=1 Tax=Neokomagataea thailandica NBRC 106555 TaxID=1223520 RepID=A0ABQ0QQT2_9PROT|nr:hypothetical protein AA106555_1352 [Neokomagataea thailandica NBRC 106555]